MLLCATMQAFSGMFEQCSFAENKSVITRDKIQPWPQKSDLILLQLSENRFMAEALGF